jgi:hypothetical protein
MTDYRVDYTPNSFNKMNAHDKHYNIDDGDRPDFKYNNNFELIDTPALNAADAEQIMNQMVYEAANQPGNLLNDPILNRARANDPTVANIFVENPIIFQPKRKLLIEYDPSIPENQPLLITNKKRNLGNFPTDQYEHFSDGTIDKELYTEFLDKNIDNPNFKTTKLLTSDKFWLQDPMVLFRGNNYYKIIPSKSMSKIEILNALTRFFFYLAILYILFSNTTDYIYIPLVGIVIVLFLYFIQKNDPISEKMEQVCRQDKCNKIDVCQKPTIGNPFMNVTMADLMDNRDRPEGCMSTDKLIKQDIDYKFNYNLFKNVEDVFDRGYSQRQFYTMPSTTIPNKQTEFAKWLYKLPETCKENQSNCLKYEDLRYNRFNPNIDRMERIREDIVN